MTWILNGVTLKKPVGFYRDQIEVAKDNTTLSGETKRDFVRQKEIFVLTLRMLTQIEIGQIMAIYNLMTPVTFVVDEGNLQIPSKNVWVKIARRNYPSKGSDYREEITLTLEEL